MHLKAVAVVVGLVGLVQAKGSVAKRDLPYDLPSYDPETPSYEPDTTYGHDEPTYDTSAPDYGHAEPDYGHAEPDYGHAEPDYGGHLACPDDGYTQVHVATHVVSWPVAIDQYFEDNTIIIINGGVTINVNNAPTSISTIVTATSTQTITTTIGPAVQTPFVVQVQGVLAKRQGGSSFLGAGGVIVGSCGQAATFTTDASGQIFSGGAQISTTAGATEQLLAVSGSVGSLSTFFSVNGGFSWTNSVFANGAASFCSKGSLLYAQFTNTIPVGCLTQVLSTIPLSACPADSTTSQSTTFTSSITSSTGFSNSTMTA